MLKKNLAKEINETKNHPSSCQQKNARLYDMYQNVSYTFRILLLQEGVSGSFTQSQGNFETDPKS